MMLFRRTALVALLALASVVVAAEETKEAEVKPVSTIYNNGGTCYDSTPFVRFEGEAKHKPFPGTFNGPFTACAWFRLPEPNEDSSAAASLFTIGDNEVWVVKSDEDEGQNNYRIALFNSVDRQFATSSVAPRFDEWSQYCVVVDENISVYTDVKTYPWVEKEGGVAEAIPGDQAAASAEATSTPKAAANNVVLEGLPTCFPFCWSIKSGPTMVASIRTRGVTGASMNIAQLPRTTANEPGRRRLLGVSENEFDEQPFSHIDVDDVRFIGYALDMDKLSAGFFEGEWPTGGLTGLFDLNDAIQAETSGAYFDTTEFFSWQLLNAGSSFTMAVQSNPDAENPARTFEVPCPQNCELGTTWEVVPGSVCSATCGGGVIKEMKSHSQEALNGGDECVDEYRTETACNTDACSAACVYKNTWMVTGKCVATSNGCGAGTQEETQDHDDAVGEGTACVAADLVRNEKKCDTGVVCPVNCVPEDTFGAYGSCSVTCGTGSKTRTRGIKIHKLGSGTDCSASDLSQSTSCDTGVVCPVNCVVGSFGAYGACSKTCGGGSQTSSRTVTTSPKGTGTACPSLTQSRTCNTAACTPACAYQLPPTLANGGYSVSGTGKGNLGEVLTLSCNSGFLFLNVPKYTCTLADGNTKATFVSADPAKPIQQVKCVQVTFAVPKAPTNGYFQYTIPADGSSTFSMKAICYPGYTVKLTSPSKSNVYTVNGQRTTISPTIAAQPLPTCVPSTRRRLLEFLER